MHVKASPEELERQKSAAAPKAKASGKAKAAPPKPTAKSSATPRTAPKPVKEQSSGASKKTPKDEQAASSQPAKRHRGKSAPEPTPEPDESASDRLQKAWWCYVVVLTHAIQKSVHNVFEPYVNVWCWKAIHVYPIICTQPILKKYIVCFCFFGI